MKQLTLLRAFATLFALFITVVISHAQTYKVLASGTFGESAAQLLQGTDGNFYGTAWDGGTNNVGTVFKMAPGGAVTVLYNFCSQTNCTDGYSPAAGLIQARDGNFYGTTYYGGKPCGYFTSCGTVFSITPAGVLTTLHTFTGGDGGDGGNPLGIVQARDGNFYGVTVGGTSSLANGTVFKMTPHGALTTLYTFCLQTGCLDGLSPNGIIQAADGIFYGTTTSGGFYGWGTAFKMTPRGTLTTLHNFCSEQSNCGDGAGPAAGLIQGTDGNFYGTTEFGGAAEGSGTGTVYEMTPTGKVRTLSSCCFIYPVAPLVQGTDGNFYGTAWDGGTGQSVCISPIPGGCGTIFEVTPAGVTTTLYEFCSQKNCADGNYPKTPLIQATNGDFYGTTSDLEGNPGGTIFRLSTGLGPFVIARPASGTVGASIPILGNGLNTATTVEFNCTSAAFTVNSSTEITAVVPVGATAGYVTVVTPKHMLKSNTVFHVTP